MARDIDGRRRVGARAAGARTGTGSGATAASDGASGGSRTGAVAAGGARRRGLGWLWLLLLLALLAALILWLALRHHGTTTAGAIASSSPSRAAVIAPLSPTAQTSTPALSSTAAAPSTSASTSTTPTVTASTPATTAAPAVSPTPVVTTAPAAPVPSVTSGGSGLAAGVASVGGGAVTAHQIATATAGEAGTVLFAADSAVLDPQGRTALAATAARLRARHTGAVTVTGFANDHTDPAANTALARARAAAVATTLRTDLAGSGTTVSTLVAGQSDPAAAETTPAGRLADARTTVTTPGTPLIGGDGVGVHPAAGSAALPTTTTGSTATAGDTATPAGVVGVALFPSASAVLDPASRAVVAAAAARITAEHPSAVTVTGYTDSVGGATGALALSRARAQTVADALRADLGNTAPAVTVRAVGAQQQIASDATADGRRLNRRTVITVS